ncbi:hypothetical protein O6H91_23G036300 [Diphasiastrum complanatum]|uniref:Uncharacterized protein n=1 Tax=Diphasiastrum complanatum TaxID=34168 RepID=A0ACC2A9N9_DIPCM|nr:hypothetical protein O6H91_23G036300 [Diphasiastrum complanatum]
MQVCDEFSDLPMDEKMEFYSDDTLKLVRFGTSVNLSEDTVLEWRNYFSQISFICGLPSLLLSGILETVPRFYESFQLS